MSTYSDNVVYRGVVEVKWPDKETKEIWSRPYDKPSPAKAWVTLKRKHLGKNLLSGDVVRSTGWAPIE